MPHRTTMPAALACAVALGCTKSRHQGPAPSARRLELGAARAPTLTPQKSGTTQRLQAVSPVDARVVWASGLGGTYALTIDGGVTWRARVVPGAEALQFRDVHGISEQIAYLLAAGAGAESRIYKTVDGGESWSLQFQNQDPQAFYDCFSFWSSGRGIALADSLGGRFPLLTTTDDDTWRVVGDRAPAALPDEGAFAASGTCVTTLGVKHAWFATSGGARPRVLATRDGGVTWGAADAPIVGGRKSAGGASVAFRDLRHGILGGGDLESMAAPSNNVARSHDGGASWQLATRTPFSGPIFGLSYALTSPPKSRGEEGGANGESLGAAEAERDEGAARPKVVATGPGGAAWSANEGDTWSSLEGVDDYWAVAFADERRGWLVGTQGRILKIEFVSD